VGLLDIDICGPSVPRMLGLEGEEIHQSGAGWSPVYVDDNLGVMSIGFMLPNQDDAVIWRGPRKNSLIKQFLKVLPFPPPSPPGSKILLFGQVVQLCYRDARVQTICRFDVPKAFRKSDVGGYRSFCVSDLLDF
jgi:hypothetical protein